MKEKHNLTQTLRDSNLQLPNNDLEQTSLFFTDDKISDEITLPDVCELLEISLATGKNWIKSGKLVPINSDEKTYSFSKVYVNDLITAFSDEKNQTLKKRRNKKQAKGCSVYREYLDNSPNLSIIEALAEQEPPLNEEELKILLANFALQSFSQKQQSIVPTQNLINLFLNNKFSVGSYDVLIWDLLETCSSVSERVSKSLDLPFYHQDFFDNLGFAYISLRCISDRKSKGAYYTPSRTVERLLQEVKQCTELTKKTVLDPCCGTGNFLLSLTKEGLALEDLHGYDIDQISISLTRINLALHYQPTNLDILYEHFLCVDTLRKPRDQVFDLIIGNPPWGFSYTSDEISFFKDTYLSGKEKNLESYDLFLEQALHLAQQKSIVAYVLPEAILTVKSHQTIREKILEHCSIAFVSQLGNIFSGVQCPTILLGLQKKGKRMSITKGCNVSTATTTFQIKEDRPFSSTEWPIFSTDLEYGCLAHLDSLSDTLTLKGKAEFALGIVTGDNKKLLSSTETLGTEGILKGNDIRKYRYDSPKNYISFQPETFQQVAQTKFYRAPERLLYRFISDTLVFAYDDQQTLSLNSCNILIPNLENHEIKYVLAILNSSVAHFYNKKKFNSVKILKSHIESIPIPKADKKIQDKVIALVDELIKGTSPVDGKHRELQLQIAKLYHLNDVQIEAIENFAGKGNLFL